MEIVNEYQKGIMDIDESKDEVKKGATAKCKKIIDETYSKISEEKAELEIELYKRKSCLLNDIKLSSDLKYDMVMSGVGAFLGVVVGQWFQEAQQTFADVKSIADPMEILSGGMSGWAVIFFMIIACVCMILHHKDDIHKDDEKDVFQADMGNYEIRKIDELLEEL